MTLVVPFDGSPLSETALLRAAEYATGLDREIRAIVVVPSNNTRYAREKGWLEPNEAFDLDAIRERLDARVAETAPEATVRYEVVAKSAPSGGIATRIRRLAVEEGASVVFIGSENAGSMVTALSSVAGGVTADRRYDVMLVRHAETA